MSSEDKKLIFLISQPRAGSTLLQKILGSHPEIHTISEPWLMLHPFYALRTNGFEAEYNAKLAKNALDDFINTLPGKENDYFEGLHRMYSYLYERTLVNSGKKYFLDKTPRYYFIIPELIRTFPDAHYIFLLRNPLSVLCSILDTWVKKNWFTLYYYRHDLIQAPRLLLEGMQILSDKGIILKYEQLLRNPEDEIKQICKRIGIEFVPEIIEYGHFDFPQWRYGDHVGINKHTRPAIENTEKWINELNNPQVWRLANGYLQLLGEEIINKMGYDYGKLKQILKERRPFKIRMLFTFSLKFLVKKERLRWLRGIIWFRNLVHEQGLRSAIVTAYQKVTHTLIKTS